MSASRALHLDPSLRRSLESPAPDEDLLLPVPGARAPEEVKVGGITVRCLRPEEEELALSLYRDCGIEGMTAELWRWRFYQRSPSLAQVAGAFDRDGGLIGCYPATVRPVRVLGRDLLALQPSWTAVRPDVRWGGRVFHLLTRFTVERCVARGVLFGFGGGVNEAAARVGARLARYAPLLEVETRERRLSLRLALARRAGGFAAAAAERLDSLFAGSLRRRIGGLELSMASEAGAEFDELWTRHRDAFPVSLRRDRREVEWRWLRCPVPARVLVLRRGGRLEGYAALRHHSDGPGRITTVLDLFCGRDPELAEALLAAAGLAAWVRRSDFLRFAPCPSSPAAALTARRPWRRAAKERDRVVVLQAVPDPAALGLEPWLRAAVRGSNWYYCQGDSDLGD
jgi:hypothetical protein